MNSYLIKFMTLYFILSNELGSSIITLDKNKEALDKSNEEVYKFVTESDSYELDGYNECLICFEKLVKDITEHKCGNKYHTECLNLWEKKSTKHDCPVCREILHPNEISEY
ncbi:uncharacterized protein LOC126910236 [Daktulosphaira vitifoliae]|uniref:uncharacterized protein LOC126910236 n=1 Tax=Daktulosphaira vitifoliae TaxID=58002 RepID=UPI0021AABDEA|nr:uncharacterized protein LOC126910236 [Daktulosphaira vitifoliae]